MITKIWSKRSGPSAIARAWDDFDAAGAPTLPTVEPPKPAYDFDVLQAAMERAGDEWAPDGSLVLHIEMDAGMVAVIDRLAALHNMDRLEVLQKGVELFKLMSTRQTYNEILTPRIRPAKR